MPLHPKVRERIDYEAASFPDLTRVPVAEGRRIAREMSAQTDRLSAPPAALDRVEDHSIILPGRKVGVRLYFPKAIDSPSPVLIYLHGGGWVFCDLETHDSLCREIATRARAVVAAVDYRRAPEDRFPAALEDCYEALRWLAEPTTGKRFDLRADRIAIGGDSAGGNMAAVLAVEARDRRGPALVGQVLICPVTAYFPGTPSYSANGSGFGFEAAFMPWMWDQYLSSPRQGGDHRVAPLGTPDLSRVAPALVITAEYDLLRDEGEMYADRLQQAGVPVRRTRYVGMVHGFLDYRGIAEEGWDAIAEIAGNLQRWFRPQAAPDHVTD
ncbi:MAG: alpha/beta hydrolase [Thermoplasmata archaeon]|nr:alpha/beta hydrolase [Thermoplasmata archaeon]